MVTYFKSNEEYYNFQHMAIIVPFRSDRWTIDVSSVLTQKRVTHLEYQMFDTFIRILNEYYTIMSQKPNPR